MKVILGPEEDPMGTLNVEKIVIKAGHGMTAEVKTEDGITTYTYVDPKEEWNGK